MAIRPEEVAPDAAFTERPTTPSHPTARRDGSQHVEWLAQPQHGLTQGHHRRPGVYPTHLHASDGP